MQDILKLRGFKNIKYFIDEPYNQIFETPEYNQNIGKNFEAVGASLSKVDKFISYYQNFFPADDKIDTSILDENLRTVRNSTLEYLSPSKKEMELLKDKYLIQQAQANLNNTISEKQIYAQHFTNGEIKIYNKSVRPLKIKQITFKNKLIHGENTVQGFGSTSNSPLILKTSIYEVADRQIKIEFTRRD